MTDPHDPDTTGLDLHFQQLVMMLGTSAMQQMGQLENPASGKAEVELEGAQFSIDLLEMLERKTRGNLDPRETKMLGEILTALRLSYVEAARHAPAAPPAAEPLAPPTAPAAAEPAKPPSAAEEPKAGKEEEGKRFRKTYG